MQNKDIKVNYTFKIQENKLEQIKVLAEDYNIAPSTFIRKIILDYLDEKGDNK